jgi:hypothetical protein
MTTDDDFEDEILALLNYLDQRELSQSRAIVILGMTIASIIQDNTLAASAVIHTLANTLDVADELTLRSRKQHFKRLRGIA